MHACTVCERVQILVVFASYIKTHNALYIKAINSEYSGISEWKSTNNQNIYAVVTLSRKTVRRFSQSGVERTWQLRGLRGNYGMCVAVFNEMF